MKKILFTLYKDRCHSLYKNFIFNPPEGYQYFTLDDFTDEFIFNESGNIFVEIRNKIKRNSFIIEIARENSIDIIYCTSGMLLFNSPIPWVVDFESVASFMIHKLKYWRFVKYLFPILLMQKNLKVLIPWTDAAANSLLQNICGWSGNIKNKMVPVYLCLRDVNEEQKKIEDGVFTILFVTTLNSNGEQEFYVKGGRVLVKIFEKLKNTIPVKFIIRAKIPGEYSFLKGIDGVEAYEDRLPEDEFKKLFLKSDILLFPCYQSPGLVFLDAMKYGLPIITTNVFSNSEMVIDEYNGFLIDFPSASTVNYLESEFGIKGVQTGKRSREDVILVEFVDEFCEKIMILYKNKHMKNSMAESSKKILLEKFTVDSRNRQLTSVYESIFNHTSNLN